MKVEKKRDNVTHSTVATGKAVDHASHLQDVVEQGRSIVHPQTFQLRGMGKLVASQLQRDLKAVGVQIVVVLHTWAMTR